MNSKLTSVFAATAVLMTLLFALSCGTGNQDLVNQNTALGSAKPTPTEADPCGTGTLAEKLAKLKTHVATKIGASNGPKGLNYQVNVKKMLSVDLTLGPGSTPSYLQLHIGGRVAGTANYVDLINIVEKVVKGNCTAAVVFDDVVWVNGGPPPSPGPATPSPSPTGTPLVPAIAASGNFIWLACEEGTIPCAGGCCPYPIHGEENNNAAPATNSNSGGGNVNK